MNQLRMLGVILLVLAAGCARDPGRCCDAFSPSEDAGVYCNAHKDVVLRFVREGPPDPAARRERLEWLKRTLTPIQPMKDSDEVHAYLAQFEKTHPGFWRQYDKQHFWAGRDTLLGLQQRGELMKCGFSHGIYELERETP